MRLTRAKRSCSNKRVHWVYSYSSFFYHDALMESAELGPALRQVWLNAVAFASISFALTPAFNKPQHCTLPFNDLHPPTLQTNYTSHAIIPQNTRRTTRGIPATFSNGYKPHSFSADNAPAAQLSRSDPVCCGWKPSDRTNY